jgi:hypothetical protein
MTHDEITDILEEARVAGQEAAKREMLHRISQAKDKRQPLDLLWRRPPLFDSGWSQQPRQVALDL